MSLLTFDDILPVFEDSVDFIVRHPNLVPGQSSTLINAIEKPYKVIRQGKYQFDWQKEKGPEPFFLWV